MFQGVNPTRLSLLAQRYGELVQSSRLLADYTGAGHIGSARAAVINKMCTPIQNGHAVAYVKKE